MQLRLVLKAVYIVGIILEVKKLLISTLKDFDVGDLE